MKTINTYLTLGNSRTLLSFEDNDDCSVLLAILFTLSGRHHFPTPVYKTEAGKYSSPRHFIRVRELAPLHSYEYCTQCLLRLIYLPAGRITGLQFLTPLTNYTIRMLEAY
jgi:hypothetical protein